MQGKTSNRVSVGPLMGDEGLVTDNKEMAGILNARYTTHLPEQELLFRGDDPLTEVRFKREEVEKKLRNLNGLMDEGDVLAIWQMSDHIFKKGAKGERCQLQASVAQLCGWEGDQGEYDGEAQPHKAIPAWVHGREVHCHQPARVHEGPDQAPR
jgi:hypothetical protein